MSMLHTTIIVAAFLAFVVIAIAAATRQEDR